MMDTNLLTVINVKFSKLFWVKPRYKLSTEDTTKPDGDHMKIQPVECYTELKVYIPDLPKNTKKTG